MRIEIPNSALIINRRDRNDVTPEEFGFTRTFRGLDEFLGLTSQVLGRYNLIAVIAGDGSKQRLLRLTKDQEHPFLDLGMGSANTHHKGLLRTEKDEIPTDLQDYFSPEKYESHLYKPPVLIHEDGSVDPCAYLVGVGHLGINSTLMKEALAANGRIKNIQLAYIVAGIQSLFNLSQRTRPTNIEYEINGLKTLVDSLHIAAMEAIGVPILATFKMNERIDPEKIRVIMMSANDRVLLWAKYALTLIVGGLLPGGVDLAARGGLIDLVDVDSVSVSPDLNKSPNVCEDGQLETLTDQRIIIKRDQKPVRFIIKTPH